MIDLFRQQREEPGGVRVGLAEELVVQGVTADLVAGVRTPTGRPQGAPGRRPR